MHALLSFGSASDLRRLINTDFSDKPVSRVTQIAGFTGWELPEKAGNDRSEIKVGARWRPR
jgi:hypothetical protein